MPENFKRGIKRKREDESNVSIYQAKLVCLLKSSAESQAERNLAPPCQGGTKGSKDSKKT